MNQYNRIINDMRQGATPTAKELALLLTADDACWLELFHMADDMRKEAVGDTVHIRGIIEFSSHCRRKCAYCGLNACNTALTRYRMQPEEIVRTAEQTFAVGYRTVVLQSGEDPWYTPGVLGQIVCEIKQKTGLFITLSCGELPPEAYAYLKDCGADRYLLKHETADPALYARLHSCGTLETRLSCLKTLKKLGYETGSGFMIGLPGQTADTIAADILQLASIPCDMAGIGPFIPSPDTPLHGCTPGSPLLTKKAVALTRLLMKTVHLPATTALGVLSADEKNDVFSCGANVVMRKVTPPEYRAKYAIYPMPRATPGTIREERAELEAAVRSLGRTPL